MKEVGQVAHQSLHRDVFGKLNLLDCRGTLSSEQSLEIFELISNRRDHHLHANLLGEVERLQVFSLPLTRNSTATCLLILIVVPVLIQNEVVNVEAEIELLDEGPPNEGLEGDRPVVDLLEGGGQEEAEGFGQV